MNTPTAAESGSNLNTLPIAPRLACKHQTGEQIERNRHRWQRAKGRGQEWFWIEVYCGDGLDGPHRQRQHILEVENLYGSPDWTQADIADDGTARVRVRGVWRDWSPRRSSGHTPRPATQRPATQRKSAARRRSASTSASRGDPPGDDDPPGECSPPAGRKRAERPTRPCPDGCGGVIFKPRRGDWPDRCDACKLSRDAARKRTDRAKAKANQDKDPCKGVHTYPRGPCRRCGAYCLPSGDRRDEHFAPRVLARQPNYPKLPLHVDEVGETASFGGDGKFIAEALWPGMGQRAPAAPTPNPAIEVIRGAVRKGLRVEVAREDGYGLIVRICAEREPRRAENALALVGLDDADADYFVELREAA